MQQGAQTCREAPTRATVRLKTNRVAAGVTGLLQSSQLNLLSVYWGGKCQMGRTRADAADQMPRMKDCSTPSLRRPGETNELARPYCELLPSQIWKSRRILAFGDPSPASLTACMAFVPPHQPSQPTHTHLEFRVQSLFEPTHGKPDQDRPNSHYCMASNHTHPTLP